MHKKFYFLFLILALGLIIAPFAVSEDAAQAPKEGDPNYPVVGPRTGVWNDGQAALWDLNVLDHFRMFGPPERLRGYQPEQPIHFSHIVHVQENKIECQYCHWTVAKSPYAALPEVQTCMGCHNIIKGSNPHYQEEIKKLEELAATNEPIPWVKVHVMPDHVKFNHKRHVKAGVTCQECHGQVPEMSVVEGVSSMKMGWCISCHREQGSTIDCAACHR